MKEGQDITDKFLIEEFREHFLKKLKIDNQDIYQRGYYKNLCLCFGRTKVSSISSKRCLGRNLKIILRRFRYNIFDKRWQGITDEFLIEKFKKHFLNKRINSQTIYQRGYYKNLCLCFGRTKVSSISSKRCLGRNLKIILRRFRYNIFDKRLYQTIKEFINSNVLDFTSLKKQKDAITKALDIIYLNKL